MLATGFATDFFNTATHTATTADTANTASSAGAGAADATQSVSTGSGAGNSGSSGTAAGSRLGAPRPGSGGSGVRPSGAAGKGFGGSGGGSGSGAQQQAQTGAGASWRQDAVAARERLPARAMGKTAPTGGNSNAHSAVNTNSNGGNKRFTDASAVAEAGGDEGSVEDFASYRNRMLSGNINNNNFNSNNNRFLDPRKAQSAKPVGVIGRLGRWIKRLFS